jgi:hypothetical protein
VDHGDLFDVTWVHLFEEDTPAGSVFVRFDSDIPLSRRPRLRFVLHDDGSAEISIPDEGDRPSAQNAHWRAENTIVLVRSDDGTRALRVVEQYVDRLVVVIVSSDS